MFVLCAAISECNNKQHSPLHVELPLEKWLEIAAAVILTGAIVSCSQKRVFVQQQTIAPITIRTCTRPSGVGRAFRAPQCSGVIFAGALRYSLFAEAMCPCSSCLNE